MLLVSIPARKYLAQMWVCNVKSANAPQAAKLIITNRKGNVVCKPISQKEGVVTQEIDPSLISTQYLRHDELDFLI